MILIQTSETSSIARKSISSQNSTDTHRSSWASFDLMNTMNDPLLLYLLQRNAQETVEERQERQVCEVTRHMFIILLVLLALILIAINAVTGSINVALPSQ